jgi:murein DD-endopeptidase MepM/ murein hydrolase activator NlpD
MSKHIRFLLSTVLMTVGYLPSFLGLFSMESSASSGGDVVASQDSFSDDSLDLICDNFLNYEENVGFVPELLHHQLDGNFFCAMMGSSENVVEAPQSLAQLPTSPCKIISPIKIIAHGELAGSKFIKDEIKSNFYCDARKLGVPAGVVDGVIKNMSSKIDFRRALKKGDKFEIIYNSKNIVLYSKIITKHKQASIYRVADKSGAAYYSDKGVKLAVKTNSNVFAPPLKGKLMVSSAFGARVHPIKRVRHIHTGVDLRAPYGAPVYAIFDGVVTRASPYEGYGNCIDIRHHSNFTSRYGHLSKYIVRCGTQVKKGQVIGYIGSSGTSTGPHLHLELARNNSLLNPLSVKMMPDEAQTVPNMKAFVALKKQIEKISLTK